MTFKGEKTKMKFQSQDKDYSTITDGDIQMSIWYNID